MVPAGESCRWLPPRAASLSHTPIPPCPRPCAADYTNTFRSLSSVPTTPAPEEEGAGGVLPAALAAALGPLEEVRRSLHALPHVSCFLP